jgi:hypothetical protein
VKGDVSGWAHTHTHTHTPCLASDSFHIVFFSSFPPLNHSRGYPAIAHRPQVTRPAPPVSRWLAQFSLYGARPIAACLMKRRHAKAREWSCVGWLHECAGMRVNTHTTTGGVRSVALAVCCRPAALCSWSALRVLWASLVGAVGQPWPAVRGAHSVQVQPAAW